MKTLLTRPVRRAGALVAAGLLLATTAACGGEADASAAQAETVSVSDPWVKAADSGMTAAFGTLRNASDVDVTVVSATSDASPTLELHEMTEDENGQMVMRRKEDGFVVPAGGTHELSPGGDHLMFLELPDAIEPGQDVTVTLTFSDDSEMSFTAPARSFAGAAEDYDPESGTGEMDHQQMGDTEGMDHGDMGHE